MFVIEKIKNSFFKLKQILFIFVCFDCFGVKDYYPVYSFCSPYYSVKCMYADNDAFGILNNDETAWDYTPKPKTDKVLPFVEIDESRMSFSKCFPFLNNPTQDDFFILTIIFLVDLVDSDSRSKISSKIFFNFPKKKDRKKQLDFLVENLLKLKNQAFGLDFINERIVEYLREILNHYEVTYEVAEKEVNEFLKLQTPCISYSLKKNFGDIETSFKWVYLDLFLDPKNKSSNYSVFFNISFYFIHSVIKKQLKGIVMHCLPKARELRNLDLIKKKKEALSRESSPIEDDNNFSAFSFQTPVSLNPNRAEKKMYAQSAAAADDELSESESSEEKNSRYSTFKHRRDDVVELIKVFESSPDKELILSCMGDHSVAFLSLIEIFKVFTVGEGGKKVDSKTVSIKPDDIYAKISLLEHENDKAAGTGRKFSLRYKNGSFPLVFHKTHDKSSKTGHQSGEFKSIKQFLGNVLSHISEEGCFL